MNVIKQRRKLILCILLVEIVIVTGAWLFGQHRAEMRPAPNGLVEPTPSTVSHYKVSLLAFNPNGRTLMIADGDPDDIGFTIYDARTGAIVRRWRDSGRQIFLSRDRKRVLESNGDGPYRHTLRDVSSGRILRRWTDRQRVLGVSPDIGQVITSTGEGVAFVQETATARVRGSFSYKPRTPGSARFSSDGRLILVDGDEHVRCIRATDLRTLLSVQYDGYRFISAGDKFVSCVDEDGFLCSWPLRGLKDGPLVRTKVSEVSGFDVLVDGSLVLTGVESSADSETYEETATDSADPVIQVRSPDGLKRLSLIPGRIIGRSPNGEYAVIFGNNTDDFGTTTYDVMRIRTGARIQSITPPAGTRLPEVICLGAVVSNDGRQAALVTLDRKIRFYKLDPQAGPFEFARPARVITSAPSSADL